MKIRYQIIRRFERSPAINLAVQARAYPVGRELFEIKKRVDKLSIPSEGFHLAFHANRQEEVHGFYEQAIKHGVGTMVHPARVLTTV